MMSCAISGYIGAPLEITSQHLMPHYDMYPIFFQPSPPTLFLLHKCLHLCFCHTSLVQGRSGVFTLTRHLHGIVHSFISLLLRSIIVSIALTFTAQPMHLIHITSMLSNPALRALSNFSSNASIPIITCFQTTSDTKLRKLHLLSWSMVARCTFLVLV